MEFTVAELKQAFTELLLNEGNISKLMSSF